MKTTKLLPCPISKHESTVENIARYGDRKLINCPVCGKYVISNSAYAVANQNTYDHRVFAWIRERGERGDSADITSDLLIRLEDNLPSYAVADKQLFLMRALERKTEFPGQQLEINSGHEFPLAWAHNASEFVYLIENLKDRNLIQQTSGPSRGLETQLFKVVITPDGWSFLEQHTRSGVISDQAFVAMAFSDEMTGAWEIGIKPAVEHSEFKPYRVDAEPHIERIDVKIMAEIKNSRFLIADVTKHRPGVYFEAGYAMGLGIPVIWTVRNNDLDNVHFDTRQYRHIVWQAPEDLAEQLKDFISAIIL